jgi:agmatinase
LKLIDYGDVDVIPVDIRATFQSIEKEVGALLEHGIKVISLGGDHSISLPLLRAHSKKFGPLAVIHFDSHSDTWESEYGKEYPFTHATPFRRAIEEQLIDPNAFVQIGIRGPLYAAGDLDDARALGAQIITINEAFEIGIQSVIEKYHTIVGNRPVYISLDIDSVDPAYAPGTGTPEVGGFNSYQILQLIRGLKNLNLIGFDLVEVCPPYDHGEITSILASNLAFEYLSLLALQIKDNKG